MTSIIVYSRQLAALVALLVAHATVSATISLGSYRSLSLQGEPLLGEVDIPQASLQDIDALRASVGSPAEYSAAGTVRDPALDGVAITLLRRPGGGYYLRLVGKTPVTAEAVDLFLQVRGVNHTVWRDYRVALKRVEPVNQPLALGLARVLSRRGEPLRAEIEVPLLPSGGRANLRAGAASPADYAALGLPYDPALAGVRISLEQRPDARFYLSVTSDKPVEVPILSFVMDASWSAGRIVRDYSLPLPIQSTASQRESRGMIGNLADDAVVPAIPTPARPELTAVQPLSSALLTSSSEPAQQTQPQRVVDVEPTGALAVSAPLAAQRGPVAPQLAAAEPVTATRPLLAANSTQETASRKQVKVRSGDTASGIALAHKPIEVSLNQMLLAMLDANPHGFIQGNVNLVKSGAVLTLPSKDDASAVSAEDAKLRLVLQTRNFDDLRLKIAQNLIGASAAAATKAKVKGELLAVQPKSRLSLSDAGMLGINSERAIAQKLQKEAKRFLQATEQINALAAQQGITIPAAVEARPKASSDGGASSPTAKAGATPARSAASQKAAPAD